MGESITSLDLYRFLLDNNISYMQEDDLKFVVQFYDIENNGSMDLMDFNHMVLCNDNMILRAKETQRTT